MASVLGGLTEATFSRKDDGHIAGWACHFAFWISLARLVCWWFSAFSNPLVSMRLLVPR